MQQPQQQAEQADKPSSPPPEAFDVSFETMAKMIREAEASGVTFREYLEKLRIAEREAIQRRELAEAVAGLCSATKVRKPRADKGKPRKAKESKEQT